MASEKLTRPLFNLNSKEIAEFYKQANENMKKWLNEWKYRIATKDDIASGQKFMMLSGDSFLPDCGPVTIQPQDIPVHKNCCITNPPIQNHSKPSLWKSKKKVAIPYVVYELANRTEKQRLANNLGRMTVEQFLNPSIGYKRSNQNVHSTGDLCIVKI